MVADIGVKCWVAIIIAFYALSVASAYSPYIWITTNTDDIAQNVNTSVTQYHFWHKWSNDTVLLYDDNGGAGGTSCSVTFSFPDLNWRYIDYVRVKMGTPGAAVAYYYSPITNDWVYAYYFDSMSSSYWSLIPVNAVTNRIKIEFEYCSWSYPLNGGPEWYGRQWDPDADWTSYILSRNLTYDEAKTGDLYLYYDLKGDTSRVDIVYNGGTMTNVASGTCISCLPQSYFPLRIKVWLNRGETVHTFTGYTYYHTPGALYYLGVISPGTFSGYTLDQNGNPLVTQVKIYQITTEYDKPTGLGYITGYGNVTVYVYQNGAPVEGAQVRITNNAGFDYMSQPTDFSGRVDITGMDKMPGWVEDGIYTFTAYLNGHPITNAGVEISESVEFSNGEPQLQYRPVILYNSFSVGGMQEQYTDDTGFFKFSYLEDGTKYFVKIYYQGILMETDLITIPFYKVYRLMLSDTMTGEAHGVIVTGTVEGTNNIRWNWYLEDSSLADLTYEYLAYNGYTSWLNHTGSLNGTITITPIGILHKLPITYINSDFVWVNLTSSNTKFWDTVKSDGSDVRFICNDQILWASVYNFNYSAETASYLVNVSSCSGNFNMYYGDSRASSIYSYHTINLAGYNVSAGSIGNEELENSVINPRIIIEGHGAIASYTGVLTTDWTQSISLPSNNNSLAFSSFGEFKATITLTGDVTYKVIYDGKILYESTKLQSYYAKNQSYGYHTMTVYAYSSGDEIGWGWASVKLESPYYQNKVRTAIKVMQLDQPVEGATVRIEDTDGKTVFQGVTGYDGRVGVELYYDKRYNVTVTYNSITVSRTFYPTQAEFVIYLPSSESTGGEPLTVYVYDELSGQPIENVRVIAGNSYAHTDSSGKAVVTRDGAINITVSCPDKDIPPRTFYVPSDQNTITVYIAPNAIKNTVIIKDVTGDYYQPLVIIRNGERIVTKAYANKQNQLETYLVEGIPYRFTLISNGKQRECGIYYASSSGTITIIVGKLKLKPSVALFRTTVSYDIGYDPDTQTVYGYYYDKTNKTDWVNFTVWNWNKTKILYSYNGTPHSPVEFTYPYSGNNSVIVEITAKRGDYTFHDLKVASVSPNLNIPMFRGDYKMEEHAVATALLIFFAGLFSYVHSRQGALMVCLFAWFLYMLGWLHVSSAILTTATAIAVFGLFGNKDVR